jgi:hypothetical protein
MILRAKEVLPDLYQTDETAWLDAMAELIRLGRQAELDYTHLLEYLEDMARRDRREVKSRLITLMAHLLKWNQQREKRSGSWRATIVAQRQELTDLLGRGVLRNHADAVLPEAYRNAVELAVAETDIPTTSFPNNCPYTLEQLLAADSELQD